MQSTQAPHPVNPRAVEEIQSLVHPEHFSSLVGRSDPPVPQEAFQLSAFQYGYEAYPLYQGQRFENVESILEKGWNASHASSGMTWKQARLAVKEGWGVLDRVLAGSLSTKGMVSTPPAPAPVPAARKPGF